MRVIDFNHYGQYYFSFLVDLSQVFFNGTVASSVGVKDGTFS